MSENGTQDFSERQIYSRYDAKNIIKELRLRYPNGYLVKELDDPNSFSEKQISSIVQYFKKLKPEEIYEVLEKLLSKESFCIPHPDVQRLEIKVHIEELEIKGAIGDIESFKNKIKSKVRRIYLWSIHDTIIKLGTTGILLYNLPFFIEELSKETSTLQILIKSTILFGGIGTICCLLYFYFLLTKAELKPREYKNLKMMKNLFGSILIGNEKALVQEKICDILTGELGLGKTSARFLSENKEILAGILAENVDYTIQNNKI